MKRLILPATKAIRPVMILIVLFSLRLSVHADDSPFTVLSTLFDQTEPDSLGLVTAEGTETITIFSPLDTTDHYSNGVIMTAFKDYLYCQWQSSAQDEDAADTWVAYSRSEDGINWTEPMVLVASIDNGYCSSGGWWVNGDTLVAYVNTWPSSVIPRGGYTRYTASTDGLNWTDPKSVLMAGGDTLKGIFEQDPHDLPDGRIINAAHMQPGLIATPIYTDDSSGVRGWLEANFENLTIDNNVSRELEPSWYLRSDDTLVMTFRDQSGTYRRLASKSGDRGENWTEAVVTNMPDSRSKQSAGNLPDGGVFLVGNPVTKKTRIPLAVTLSPEGFFFNTAYVLRKGGNDLQSLRYDGQYKREGYHYPKTTIWQDYFCVSYSTNKEDVQYTRVPLASLIIDTLSVDTALNTSVPIYSAADENITIGLRPDKMISIRLDGNCDEGFLSIYTTKGQLLSVKTIKREIFYDMKKYPAGLYILDVKTDEGRKTQLVNIR